MANDIAMTIRTNSKVKSEAQELFSDLGMDMSTAINVFLRQSVRERRIPFVITQDEPSEETYKAIEDAKNDKNMVGPFNSVDELVESLDTDNSTSS